MLGTILGTCAIIWLVAKSERYRDIARGIRKKSSCCNAETWTTRKGNTVCVRCKKIEKEKL